MKYDLSRHSLAVPALVALLALVVSGCSDAPDATGSGPAAESQSAVNIGYQGMLNPWKAAIPDGGLREGDRPHDQLAKVQLGRGGHHQHGVRRH